MKILHIGGELRTGANIVRIIIRECFTAARTIVVVCPVKGGCSTFRGKNRFYMLVQKFYPWEELNFLHIRVDIFTNRMSSYLGAIFLHTGRAFGDRDDSFMFGLCRVNNETLSARTP